MPLAGLDGVVTTIEAGSGGGLVAVSESGGGVILGGIRQDPSEEVLDEFVDVNEALENTKLEEFREDDVLEADIDDVIVEEEVDQCDAVEPGVVSCVAECDILLSSSLSLPPLFSSWSSRSESIALIEPSSPDRSPLSGPISSVPFDMSDAASVKWREIQLIAL